VNITVYGGDADGDEVLEKRLHSEELVAWEPWSLQAYCSEYFWTDMDSITDHASLAMSLNASQFSRHWACFGKLTYLIFPPLVDVALSLCCCPQKLSLLLIDTVVAQPPLT